MDDSAESSATDLSGSPRAIPNRDLWSSSIERLDDELENVVLPGTEAFAAGRRLARRSRDSRAVVHDGSHALGPGAAGHCVKRRPYCRQTALEVAAGQRLLDPFGEYLVGSA